MRLIKITEKIISISDKKIIRKIKRKQSKNKITLIENSKIINKVLKNNKFYKFNGLAIDSRDVKKENIFLAIKGKTMMEINLFHKQSRRVLK